MFPTTSHPADDGMTVRVKNQRSAGNLSTVDPPHRAIIGSCRFGNLLPRSNRVGRCAGHEPRRMQAVGLEAGRWDYALGSAFAPGLQAAKHQAIEDQVQELDAERR